MDFEPLPIKFFAPREVDELVVEGGGSSDKPKWVLIGEELKQRAEKLSAALDVIEGQLVERKKKSSLVPFTFVAKIQEDSTAKSKRSYVTGMLHVGVMSGVIGVATNNKLLVCVESLEQIKAIEQRINDYEENDYAISCIDDFEEFVPRIYITDWESNYKVKLVDYQNYEQNLALRRLLERTLDAHNLEYKKTEYSEKSYIYNIRKVSKSVLDEIQSSDVYNAIFSVEPMPRYMATLDVLESDESIPIKKPIVDKEYVTIGILDNGIAKIPNLSPWIVDRWSPYPEDSIAATHGTFVAGIALEGDECEGKKWIGHQGIKLFDAAIFPDTNKEGLEEDELIENIREAISRYHEHVKIWNLSISIMRPVVDSKFSDFAIALDALQDKYDVLICKSAGNCDNFSRNVPKGRIHEGADSVRTLVVGSFAHEKSKYDYAEINDPSPFSRIGPGPEFIIKPEVSHYGGNAGVDINGNIVTSGVKSFDKNGKVAKAVGTSFSTPRITSLAAGIQQELNEEFDALLLKALIVHSATYPTEMTVPSIERANQIGFGIPKTVSQIIYNSPHEATLILRDNLAKGDIIDIMDFPMPKCLIKDGFYTGQIVVTLVYDPVLEPSQGIEYCQSNLDVKFGSYDEKEARDLSKRTILNPIGRKNAKNLLLGNVFSKKKMKSQTGEFALKERLQIQYGDKYYPVKKYAVDLSELTEKNKIDLLSADRQWFLYLKGVYREYVERMSQLHSYQLSQEFCLIITVRDPEGKENVYDEVTQKLDEYHFWHSNIKIANEVRVPVTRELEK